jgi:hypothetical protein
MVPTTSCEERITKHTRASASQEAIANRLAGKAAAKAKREAAGPALATYTIVEFARLTGVSETTAYDHARADELPVKVIRIGNRMFVSRAAVNTLLGIVEPPPLPIPTIDELLATKGQAASLATPEEESPEVTPATTGRRRGHRKYEQTAQGSPLAAKAGRVAPLST